MKNQNNVLLEKASEKLETLLELKNFAVKVKDYELGAKCREIELEKFPITQEQTEAKDEADKLNLLFRMVELNIDEKFCYRIARAFELYKKKKGKFDIKDASKIIVDSERLFQRK
jgi:hypothetical protein